MMFVGNKLSPSMKVALSKPITLKEVSRALSEMAKGKVPRPNGMVTKFFKVYWDLIKTDYLKLVNEAIRCGKFPSGVTRGVISLLHKGDLRTKLTN